jgi:hypothetical protein
MEFSVAVPTSEWYGFAVFIRPGVPCLTEQIAAKLAGLT